MNRTASQLPHPLVTAIKGVFVAGFVTIGSQILLWREVFATLAGSDLAIAFTLASWTALSAAGSWLPGRWIRPPRKLLPFLPAVYVAIVCAVFLGIRRWRSAELISFASYVRIPLWLAAPCLLGGALFPWYAGRVPEGDDSAVLTACYGLETFGGMVSGLALAVFFSLRGLSCAALAWLLILGFWHAVSSLRRRTRRAGYWGLVACGLLLLCSPLATRLENAAEGLRFPGGTVVERVNTAYAPLTAIRSPRGEVTVYESGIPLPLPESTPAKEALFALLASLPERWDRVLLVGPLSSGFSRTMERFRDCRLLYYEVDAAKIRFLRKWYPELSDGPLPARASSPVGSAEESLDLAAVFGPPPSSLLANRHFTATYFRRIHTRLRPGGVLAIVLPMAPGFMHPLQRRYVDCIRASLQLVFSQVGEIRTELGWLVLTGSELPRPFRKRPDLGGRFHRLSPDIEAELDRLADAESVRRLLEIPPKLDAPPNRILNPVAYFHFLLFRGRMLEEAPPLYARFLSPKPWLWSAGMLAAIILVSRSTTRGDPLLPALFWASWLDTMVVMFSVYIYQAFVGQAFWAVSLMIAANLAGISAAAWRDFRGRVFVHRGALLFLPLVLACSPLLPYLPDAMLLCLLVGGCVWTGLLAGRSFAAGSASGASGSVLFAVDLLGSAGGLLIGSGVLVFWGGFVPAGLLCSAAIALGISGPKSVRNL